MEKERHITNQIEELCTKNLLLLDLSTISLCDVKTVGGKAARLGEMLRAGLPVPSGSVIPTHAFEEYKTNKKLPSGLVEAVIKRKQELGGAIALRSSATVEDGDTISMAGVFNTHYIKDDNDVEIRLKDIYEQAYSEEVVHILNRHSISEKPKMGVVVQRLITPDISGVIYTEINRDKTLVQYVPGFGQKLVDGMIHGSALIVNNQTGEIGESNNFEQLPISEQLLAEIINYGKKAEEVFGGVAQDVEFVVTDGTVYLVQSRKLTTELDSVDLHETVEDTLDGVKEKLKKIAKQEKDILGTEKTIVSDSNFSELLPNPKEMDFGVFAYIFTGQNGVPGAIQLGRQQMGYDIDTDLPLEHTYFIGGRPYFSIAVDSLTFYAGFPRNKKLYLDVLGKEYLDAIDAEPEKGLYPEMGLYLQDPVFSELVTRFGENEGQAGMTTYQEFTYRMGEYAAMFMDQFQEVELPSIEAFISQMKLVNIDMLEPSELSEFSTSILEHLRTVSCVDFVKAARLGFYYSQRLLAELCSTFEMDDEDAQRTFGLLNQGLEGSAITEADVSISRAPSAAQALKIARELVGHYSVGEMLEIRHKRLKDSMEHLKSHVEGLRSGVSCEQRHSQQQNKRRETEDMLFSQLSDEKREDFYTILKASQTYMALRETVKYHFVREYAILRDSLEALNRKISFPEGDIYSVYPQELVSLATNPRSFRHIISARQQAFENYTQLNLPHVIREQDVEKLSVDEHVMEDFNEMKGKFLSDPDKGPVTGVVINLKDFSEPESLSEYIQLLHNSGKTIIFAAQTLNLGQDYLLTHADGLILQNAGLSSHGAQRAREYGVPAIGGINILSLKTGMELFLDPKTRIVKKVRKE